MIQQFCLSAKTSSRYFDNPNPNRLLVLFFQSYNDSHVKESSLCDNIFQIFTLSKCETHYILISSTRLVFVQLRPNIIIWDNPVIWNKKANTRVYVMYGIRLKLLQKSNTRNWKTKRPIISFTQNLRTNHLFLYGSISRPIWYYGPLAFWWVTDRWVLDDLCFVAGEGDRQ